MSNSIFNDLNKNQQNGIEQQFQQFMQFMQGKDPNVMINEIVRSGRITQEQLNFVQHRAQQMQGMFEKFKGMFGR